MKTNFSPLKTALFSLILVVATAAGARADDKVVTLNGQKWDLQSVSVEGWSDIGAFLGVVIPYSPTCTLQLKSLDSKQKISIEVTDFWRTSTAEKFAEKLNSQKSDSIIITAPVSRDSRTISAKTKDFKFSATTETLTLTKVNKSYLDGIPSSSDVAQSKLYEEKIMIKYKSIRPDVAPANIGH